MNGLSLSTITPKQKWYGVCGAVGLLVLVLGFLLLIKPRMDKPGEINGQKAGVDQQISTQTVKLHGLQAKAAQLPLEQRIAKAIGMKFPSTADQNNLLAQIHQAASQAGLSESAISGLTLGVPQVQVATGSGVTVPGGSSDGSTDTTAPSTAPSAAPTAPAASAAPASGRLATMSVSMSVTASPSKFRSFLHALENGERAFLVNSVTVGQDGGGGSTGASSIDGTMFIIPGPNTSKSAAPGGVVVAPSPAATTPGN